MIIRQKKGGATSKNRRDEKEETMKKQRKLEKKNVRDDKIKEGDGGRNKNNIIIRGQPRTLCREA